MVVVVVVVDILSCLVFSFLSLLVLLNMSVCPSVYLSTCFQGFEGLYTYFCLNTLSTHSTSYIYPPYTGNLSDSHAIHAPSYVKGNLLRNKKFIDWSEALDDGGNY